MTAGRAVFLVPILAVAAFTATLGGLAYRHTRADLAAGPISPDAPVRSASPGADAPAAGPIALATPPTGAVPRSASTSPPGGAGPPPQTAPGPGSGEALAPSFDVVRVEPTGESVVAGRAPSGASVRLLVDGETVATGVADASGQFVFVPAPILPGSHDVALEVTAADGTRVQSRQSVTVVIAANRQEPPLVTVTAPGQPVVILSRPDAPSKMASAEPAPTSLQVPAPGSTWAATPAPAVPSSPAAARAEPSRQVSERPPAPSASIPAPQAAVPAPQPGKRPGIKIAAVEAAGAGRLYVSGQSAPDATIRLYLNDTFLAPAASGADGRLAFSIERGIQPGAYRIRLDDVDSVTGGVRSRAEVGFTMPAQAMASADLRGAPASRPDPEMAFPESRPRIDILAAAAPQPPAVAAPGASEPKPASPSVPSDAGSSDAAPERRPERVARGTTPRVGDPGAEASPPVRDGPVPVVIPEVKTALVTRGESLWEISRRVYGDGVRYTVIYGANAPQIRDPNLIYPGQVFVLPDTPRQGASR